MSIQRVVILGSTGSIGINTLKVIERFPKKFKVVGLTAFNNIKLLERQVRKFSPTHVAVNPPGIRSLKNALGGKKIKILDVTKEAVEIVKLPAVDIVVIAMQGSAALAPFLEAVRRGKRVAPANKEALVIAGDLLMKEARASGAVIVPIDSEQSAIFQCLDGQKNRLKKIYLTASGGPLHKMPVSRFNRISVREILKHPRWKMGRRITVDSATLMNKGFEMIETKRLFDIPVDDIKVLVHPEAIIHSMVEFCDGSILAQLGITDMRLPIQYALSYPERLDTGLPAMDFYKLGQLTFAKPDTKKFPALQLAIEVARRGGTLPSALNAADEEAVDAFLNGQIGFLKIYDVVAKVVRRHRSVSKPELSDVLNADQDAREEARRVISQF